MDMADEPLKQDEIKKTPEYKALRKALGLDTESKNPVKTATWVKALMMWLSFKR